MGSGTDAILPADFAPPTLPNLTIPTLVIWALDDTALPPANLDGIEEFIDPMTLVEIPDCGHFLTWEAPEEVNAAIEGFLGKTA